jgi:hypothetical protein
MSTDATRADDRHEAASRFFWRFTLRDGMLMALLAALVFISKTFVKIPVHVPGHSGVIWIALMVVGAGLIRRFGTAFVIGFVAGMLVTLFGWGRDSLLEWTRYAAAGLTLDVVGLLLGGRFESPVVAAIAGAAAHVAKLVTMLIVGLLLRLPAAFLGIGLGVAATTHLVFGVLGGIVGALLLRVLSGVPGLRREGPARQAPRAHEAQP